MKTVSYLFLVITKGILDMSSTNLNLSMEKNYLNILYTSNLKDRLWNQQLNLLLNLETGREIQLEVRWSQEGRFKLEEEGRVKVGRDKVMV